VTEPKVRRTKSGKVLSDTVLDAISREVESMNYSVESLKARRRGRRTMGSGPAEVLPVGLDPDVRKAVEARADEDDTTTSEVIRQALRDFLHVA
jgi:hypothetical protein